MKRSTMKDLGFYILLLAIPVTNFCIFYIGVNFNSILLAFKDFDVLTNTFTWTTDNFTKAFNLLTSDYTYLKTFGNSLLMWLCTWGIGTLLALFFSYYIFNKMRGSEFFRVMLFLPSIISAIALVLIYAFFMDRALPDLINKLFGVEMPGLIENAETQFAAVIFYNIIMGFGTNTLMYSNAMSGISPEVIEASRLDGAVGIRQFLHVVFPMVYPTFVTFTVIGIASIFTNQANLFSFFGSSASTNVMTFGYHFYNTTYQAGANLAQYPLLAATGLWLTVIAVPLTFGIKWVIEKIGPKT